MSIISQLRFLLFSILSLCTIVPYLFMLNTTFYPYYLYLLHYLFIYSNPTILILHVHFIVYIPFFFYKILSTIFITIFRRCCYIHPHFVQLQIHHFSSNFREKKKKRKFKIHFHLTDVWCRPSTHHMCSLSGLASFRIHQTQTNR